MSAKSTLIRFVIFLILNFGTLALGNLATGEGVISGWYLGLNKAPWTPPGWVFGATWTLIMLLLSIYMTYLWSRDVYRPQVAQIYGLQLLLNIAWNPVFFSMRQPVLGLIVIVSLLAVVITIYRRYRSVMGSLSYLLLPYIIWLIIATSLNTYIVLYN